MKNLMKTMVLFMLGLLSSSMLSAQENELEARVKSWVKSYNSNDLAKMTEFYEDSDKVNILISSGLWNKGTKEYKKLLKKDIAEVKFYDSHSEGLVVRDMGDFGVAAFIHQFKFKVLEGGQHIQVHIRTTMTLRKIEGTWKIIQEHSSPILRVQSHRMIDPPAK